MVLKNILFVLFACSISACKVTKNDQYVSSIQQIFTDLDRSMASWDLLIAIRPDVYPMNTLVSDGKRIFLEDKPFPGIIQVRYEYEEVIKKLRIVQFEFMDQTACDQFKEKQLSRLKKVGNKWIIGGRAEFELTLLDSKIKLSRIPDRQTF